MKHQKIVFVAATLLLLLVNIYAVSFLEPVLERWVRTLSAGILFFYYFRRIISKELIFTCSFVLLLISNICYVYYEILYFKLGFFIAGLFSYSLLIFYLFPEVKDFQSTLVQKILFVIVVFLDAYMLMILIDMIPEELRDSILYSLFFLYGIVIILLKIVAVLFCNTYSNKSSFFFMCAVLGLVFSDVTLFVAYYIGFTEFYLPARILYILGLASLVRFSGLNKKEGVILDFQ